MLSPQWLHDGSRLYHNGSAALSQKDYRTVTSGGCQLTMTAQPGYQVKEPYHEQWWHPDPGTGRSLFETLSLDSTTIQVAECGSGVDPDLRQEYPYLAKQFLAQCGASQNLIWVSYGDFAMQSSSFVGYLYAGGK